MKITYIEIDNVCYRYYYDISKKIIAEIKEKLCHQMKPEQMKSVNR